jgi:ribosomal protein L29
MKPLKVAELRRLTMPELVEQEHAVRGALLKARIQHSQRQFAKTADVRTMRHNLARILTVRTERGNAKEAKS